MKFTTVAAVAAIAATAAAMPVGNSNLETRMEAPVHPVDAWKQFRKGHAVHEALEDKNEAEEDRLEDENWAKLKKATFHGSADGGFSPKAGVKQWWDNRSTKHDMEHNHKDAEHDAERQNRKEIWAAFTGKNQNQQGEAKVTVMPKATVKRGLGDTASNAWGGVTKAWTVRTEAHKAEKELEDAQEAELKKLKDSQKEVMKKLKDESWATWWAATKNGEIQNSWTSWRKGSKAEDQLEKEQEKDLDEMKARHKEERKKLAKEDRAKIWEAVKTVGQTPKKADVETQTEATEATKETSH